MTETSGESAVAVETVAAPEAPKAELGDGVVRPIEEARALALKAMEEAEAADAKPKADETSPETPKAERKSRAIAEKAKKDAAFFKQKQEVEAKAKRIASIEDLTARIKAGDADPDDLLGELGIDYRTLTERKLANGKKPKSETEVLSDEVAAIKAELAAERAELKAQRDNMQREQATQAVMGSIDSVTKADPDRWDAIVTQGKHNDVLAEMQKHLKETATEWDADGRPVDGEVLTVEAAADIVEARLADEARKWATSKYVRQSSAAAPADVTPGQVAVNGTGSRTLTNGHGAIGGGRVVGEDGIVRYDTVEQFRRAFLANE